jgi:hypothetical protein
LQVEIGPSTPVTADDRASVNVVPPHGRTGPRISSALGSATPPTAVT